MNITALRTPTGGEADQLAIYKRGRGVEVRATENNSQLVLERERDLKPGPGFQVQCPNHLATPCLPFRGYY